MKFAKIFNDPLELIKELDIFREPACFAYEPYVIYPKKIVVTSGGFDPLHIGHLRCIQQSALIADANYGFLVVIVNGDGFLTRKKGKPFMPHAERMEIIAGLRGVDYVVGWDDGSQTVTGALEIIKPNIFTKGGDRNIKENVPEFDLCTQIGCKVLFGIGGDKIQSSSNLLKGI